MATLRKTRAPWGAPSRTRLSQRELTDLGIARLDIPATAYQPTR